MLVNMIGVEEDLDVVPIRQGSEDAQDPKSRVTITTLVGALLTSYASAAPIPAPGPPATVTSLAMDEESAVDDADPSDQRWYAA